MVSPMSDFGTSTPGQLRAPRELCPLCRSSLRRPLRRVTRRDETFDIATCRDCRFVYVIDPPRETADVADPDVLVWRQARRHFQMRELFCRQLAPTARIVEIGCGRGDLGRTLAGDRFSTSDSTCAKVTSSSAASTGSTCAVRHSSARSTAMPLCSTMCWSTFGSRGN